MKENRYDEEIFFKKYSQFPRSVQGLRAAGEWHELEAMLAVDLDGIVCMLRSMEPNR